MQIDKLLNSLANGQSSWQHSDGANRQPSAPVGYSIWQLENFLGVMPLPLAGDSAKKRRQARQAIFATFATFLADKNALRVLSGQQSRLLWEILSQTVTYGQTVCGITFTDRQLAFVDRLERRFGRADSLRLIDGVKTQFRHAKRRYVRWRKSPRQPKKLVWISNGRYWVNRDQTTQHITYTKHSTPLTAPNTEWPAYLAAVAMLAAITTQPERRLLTN